MIELKLLIIMFVLGSNLEFCFKLSENVKKS